MPQFIARDAMDRGMRMEPGAQYPRILMTTPQRVTTVKLAEYINEQYAPGERLGRYEEEGKSGKMLAIYYLGGPWWHVFVWCVRELV